MGVVSKFIGVVTLASMSASAAANWALERIGHVAPDIETPVIVAVIDSGLDYQHPAIESRLIWRNDKDQPDGKDNDGNGYTDDIIGWDFIDNDNNPWDTFGHGTFVTGLIASMPGQHQQFSGVASNVRIMPLRALNSAGYGDGLALAAAVFYAVDHGAKVINLSLGRVGLDVVDLAIVRYAAKQDVVLVIAAGNQATDVSGIGPAGVASAASTTLVVAATNSNDEIAEFSNKGRRIDVAAPGVDLLSLRARRTDFNWVSDVAGYQPGDGFQGQKMQFYTSTGTSFAAPLVAGLAAELRARHPTVDAATIVRMVKQSAMDIGASGVDYQSGYGRIDFSAAMQLEPDFFVDAEITGVTVEQSQGQVQLAVSGVADANKFASGTLSLGRGEDPKKWNRKTFSAQRNAGGVLVRIDADAFKGASVWTVRLVVKHSSGKTRESRYVLNVG